MFIIIVTFKKSLETLAQYLTAHREFLDTCYKKDYFIASGQNQEHSGGIIISQLNNKSQLQDIISQDPLYKKDIANYEILEFTPTKYHQAFSTFLNNDKPEEKLFA